MKYAMLGFIITAQLFITVAGQSPTAATASVAGTYHYKTYRPGKEGYDNTLEVEDKGGGNLHVSLSGAYMYRANGAETMHDGDGEGDATLSGNAATGRVLSGDSPCGVVIIFEGDKARVKMGNDCDHSFYILDGTYIKENSAVERAPGTNVAASPSHPSVPRASTSPEEVVRQFYDWYLHAHFPAPKRQNLAKFRGYVTQRFLREQMSPDADADLFLGDTSDPDEAWARGDFGVTTAAIQGQRATVQVTLRGGEVPTYRLRVTLRREQGAWKIDGVERV